MARRMNRSLPALMTLGFGAALGFGLFSCSSTDTPATNPGAGGTSGGTAPTAGSGGSGTPTAGTGGTPGASGSGGSGMAGTPAGGSGGSDMGGSGGTGGDGVGGTGGDGVGGNGGSGGMVPAGPIMLMSDDLIEAEGLPMWQLKPEQCRMNDSPNGNQSPHLTWTPGPEGTMSYALSFYDMENNGTHWVLYNIPADVHELPAGFNKDDTMPAEFPGSVQTQFGGQTGYFGPGAGCRPYRFEVWALNVADLDAGTDRNQLREDALPAALVSEEGHAQLDVRGQNSGQPCGPIAGYDPND